MANYRFSEKIVKSIFIFVPVVVLLSLIGAVVIPIVILNAIANSPSEYFYDTTSLTFIEEALKSDKDLSYYQNGEYLVSNSDFAKKYMQDTLLGKIDNREYKSIEDINLNYSYKLKLPATWDNFNILFYLFNEDNKIGVRCQSGSDTENQKGFIRYYPYEIGETNYLVHTIMDI